MCRLRAFMWALVGLTVCTCIASVRWFFLSDHFVTDQRVPLATPTAGGVYKLEENDADFERGNQFNRTPFDTS